MRNALMTFVLAGLLALAVAAPAVAQDTDPIAVLKSDASLKEKSDACRTLSIHGGQEAVPVLAPLLVDDKLSHMARYALEPMPFSEAGEALRDALGKTSGRLKVGMVHSLGMRKDEQAVPALIALLPDADEAVAQAAARALGKIATPEATAALEDAVAQAGVSPGNLLAFCEGLLACAEKLAGTGQPAQAIALYDSLLNVPNTPRQVRTGALRGLVLACGPKQGLPKLLEAVHGEDDAMFAAALRVSRELGEDPEVTAALAAALAPLPAERKIRLIQALGYRGGAEAGPAVLAEAKDGPTEVRVAALRALARMGYSPALALMASLTCTEDKDLAKAARNALSYFPGHDGDAALIAMLDNKEAEARRIAIELIGQGGLHDPVDLLMNAAESDADESVRIAALKTLEDYARMAQMPGLLDRLLAAQAEAEIKAAEKALGALCAREKRAPTSSVVIQKAVYGDLPDGPSADVTGKVAAIVKSGSLSVAASNGNFGDPAPSIVKRLRVDYTDNEVPFSKTVQENQSLVFTATATAPPVLVDALCVALEKAQGESKLALLRLLGPTGSRKALDTVRAAAAADDQGVKETALRTLCEWPTPDALPVLMELVKSYPDQTMRVLALRGAVRLLDKGTAGTAELLQHYAVLMEHARTEEKKSVLSGLAQVHHVAALEMALSQFADESVKAETVQAAISIAQNLGKAAREEKNLLNGKDLDGWQGTMDFWRFEDGAVVGHSDADTPSTTYVWAPVTVGDFYLSVDVQLEPDTGNSGIQFRTEKRGENGDAFGCQADIGRDVWGRIYDQGGRGKLDWSDGAEKAVKPGEWNHYEILAVGPAMWLAINGQLGAACLDLGKDGERSGQIALQFHAGAPKTVRYRFKQLIHNPKVELTGMTAEQLIPVLKVPGQ